MRARKISVMKISLCVFLIFGLIGTAAAADKIRWKYTTTWTPSIQLIEADKNFVKLVNQLAGDKIDIKFFEGGALVPPFETFGAVASGTVQAGGDWPNYWSGKDTAFDLLGSYPYGLTPIDYMVWIYQGGGLELYQEVYGKFGIMYLPHGVTPMESGVRSNKPIKSIEDYKGLKIRMSGRTQGLLLKDIGASQVNMAGGEIYQALQKGVLDAAEFNTPNVDWGMGFGEVTKYWASPGWHQPASMLGVMINKKAWDDLGPELQEVFKIAAMANFTWSFSFYAYGNIEGTQKFIDNGTEITRLNDADLAKLQQFTNQHTLESAKENPLFAKVAYSQLKFLQDYKAWRSIAEPFSFGRNPELPDLEAIKAQIK